MNTLKNNSPSRRDIFYFRQRQKNRVYSAVLEYFVSLVDTQKISKKQLAEKLNKDPAQITRWLNAPGNWTLDTVSDLLLAMDAEMKHEVVPLNSEERVTTTVSEGDFHNIHNTGGYQVTYAQQN